MKPPLLVQCCLFILDLKCIFDDDDLVGSLVGIYVYDPCLYATYLPQFLICIEVRYSFLPRHHSTVGLKWKSSAIKNVFASGYWLHDYLKGYNQSFLTFYFAQQAHLDSWSLSF